MRLTETAKVVDPQVLDPGVADRHLHPFLEASGVEQGDHRNGVLGERLAAHKPQVEIDHFLPREAERHLRRDDGAHARATDHIDGDAKLA